MFSLATCVKHCRLIGRPLRGHLKPTSARGFKYKSNRSFLSDKEGAKNFVELLGFKERRILLDELRTRIQTGPDGDLGEDGIRPEEPPPDGKQLRLLFIHQTLPFLGFGFLDNLIMIVAGDYIDATIGVTLGISTMAAAGLGNALSDMAGVGSAWYVEKIAAKVGVEFPKMSPAQTDMARTRWVIQLGRAIGVTVGCLLGMFPLLFLPNKEEGKSARAKESKDSK